LYINPIFDEQAYCWSSDTFPEGSLNREIDQNGPKRNSEKFTPAGTSADDIYFASVFPQHRSMNSG